MNGPRQFRVLYRDFLFRLVDRELLASHAKGDASRLVLQLASLLLCVGGLASLPALFFSVGQNAPARLTFAWGIEHFLIATMLAVGVFAVLGWGSMFPDRRDIMVLAPLPVRARTILAAKLAALGVGLAAIVLALHVVAGVAWPLRLNAKASAFPTLALTRASALPPLGAGDLQAVLDEDLAPLLRNGALAPGRGAGLAIAVSTNGTQRLFAYGAATPDSLFHIASITKVFTGVALAHMIAEGRVNADDPVRALIPAARLEPPRGGRNDITLRDLVTHHSGIRDVAAARGARDLPPPMPGQDVQRLYAFLRGRGIARPPDPHFEYSNIGMGLLGHALATRAGMDYEQLIRDRITGPLAMRDTVVALTSDQQRRLLAGLGRDYQPVETPPVAGAIAGAGALRSSARDLIAWAEANLHPERLAAGRLREAIAASHERQAGVDGDVGIGFAWGLTGAGDIAHAGGMPGYSSVLSLNPSKDRAIVVLANVSPGAAISANVVGDYIRARLEGEAPIALSEVTIPTQGGIGGWLRLLAAYWMTMAAAGLFVFALTVSLQGIAAALLPHRYFLRVSSILQMVVLFTVVIGYFLQPLAAGASAILDAQQAPWYQSSPSFWFLGLFQMLAGSPALSLLAQRALAGLAISVSAAVVVNAVCYLRTLRRLTEEPDVAPVIQAARRLPPVGGGGPTAVVHFSARTLLRSAQHRIIYTFYLGIGFALSAVLLKTPRTAQLDEDGAFAIGGDMSKALVVSSIVMMVCAVVGARLTFAMPRELGANWIFRVLPIRSGRRFTAARRRALIVVAAAPVWIGWAAVFLMTWPWTSAIGHLAILAMIGLVLVELCLSGPQGIPFTSAYVPGGTHSNVTVPAAVIALLVLMLVLADAEQRALEDGRRFLVIIAALAVAWTAARVRSSWLADVPQLEFEDEDPDRAVSLEVWDVMHPLPRDSEQVIERPVAH
jgi:CubicO group peptidase (beta-lactamase class C family)